MNSLKTSDAVDLSNIKEESRLLREIKDILDELKMILMIFEEQAEIRESMMREKPFVWGPGVLRHQSILEPVSQYISKIRKLEAQAKTTYESVRTLLAIFFVRILINVYS